MIPNFYFFKVVGKPFAVTICMTLVNKGPQSRLKWKNAFCRQKGVEDALGHRFESLHSLVVGIFGWLYGWWNHSYPAGHCHHRCADPHYSGTEMIGVI